MKSQLIYILIFSGLFLLCGCKKPGCTSTAALNYSNEAKTDDGSCLYSGQAYVHYSYTTQSNFEDDGITDLEIYVDGEFIGLQKTNVQVASLGCNGSTTVTKTFDMGTSYNLVKMLTVKNQSNGQVIYTSEFTLYSNNCVAMVIVY